MGDSESNPVKQVDERAGWAWFMAMPKVASIAESNPVAEHAHGLVQLIALH